MPFSEVATAFLPGSRPVKLAKNIVGRPSTIAKLAATVGGASSSIRLSEPSASINSLGGFLAPRGKIGLEPVEKRRGRVIFESHRIRAVRETRGTCPQQNEPNALLLKRLH